MITQRLHSNLPLSLLEWLARTGSILSVGLVVLLFLGEGGFHPSTITAREWTGLGFFPIGVVLGMVVAWWREGLGALISVTSLTAFYFVYGYLLGSHIGGWWFVIFTLPAFLFLLHWLLVCNWHAEPQKST